ncbi:MAG: enolase C-terminal domain-like protein [Acidothermaceae bacterium]
MTDDQPLSDRVGSLDDVTAPPWRHVDDLRITSVRSIVTAPEGVPLVVVRVDTSDDGLYGLGCATFTQRFSAVTAVVDEYIAPLVHGRHPADIGDLTRMVHHSSYWRAGPVLNNALSGLDMALWDIAGKRAGSPVHDLLGGRVRAAAPTYLHAGGVDIAETLAHAEEIIAGGWSHVRLQTGQPGAGTYGSRPTGERYENRPHPDGWDVGHYRRETPALFAAARERLGTSVELLHDVHSRLTPKRAIMLARSLEAYRLFFLEDVVAPEHYDRLPEVRAASPIPIAVGELLVAVPDAVRLVLSGSVDFLRLHLSAVGGLTPARKLTALCELVGVQTAWHAPADVSPVGAAANLALDVSTPAFGIQEGHVYNDAACAVFPGTPQPRLGHLVPSSAPGFGVDLDEREAAKYPPRLLAHDRWAVRVRATDGGLLAP